MKSPMGKAAKLSSDYPTSPTAASHLTLNCFNTPTRNVLKRHCGHGDGQVGTKELQSVVGSLIAEEHNSQLFKRGMLVASACAVVLLLATFGLTWTVVVVLKDTRVQGGVLVTNDASRATVMTASTELLVQRGRLVERGPDGASTGHVLSTAAYRGRAALSPAMPMDVLMGVQMLVLSTPSGGELALSVQAIFRAPSNSSAGHVLKLHTPAGLLVVAEDGSLAVQGPPGQLLEDAGFTSEEVAGAPGRRLLEALRYYIYCSTQDCTSWSPEERNMCGGDTGISCAMVAADGDYMFVDDPLPPSPAALAPPPPPPPPPHGSQNSASVGYSGGCGSTITVTTSSCLAAAELCYSRGNALVSSAPLTTIANNNYKCRQAQCTNGATWGWTTLSSYTFQGGGTATLSFCAGTKLWTFCC